VKNAIFILGMHRSGTSALTGVLSYLGVALGSELLSPQSDNVKGYYENKKVVTLNEDILRSIKSSWDDIGFGLKKLEKCSLEYINRIYELFIDEFSKEDLFAIKDPRICYLFPLYEKALDKLDYNIKIIIPYRNPLEVAMSLQKRNGFDIEKGLLLWLKYFVFAEKFSRDYERIFVSFDELLNNTEEVIKKIDKTLDLNLLDNYHKNKDLIKNFLEPSLKHHNIQSSYKMPGVILSLLDALKRNNIEQIKNISDNVWDIDNLYNLFVSDLDEKLEKATKKINFLEHENKLLELELKLKSKEISALEEHIKNLEEELATIYSSSSWKITRPLRRIKKG